MPRVEIVFFQEADETVPILVWLQVVGRRDSRIAQKCQQRIDQLADLGHELRRPQADLLRDGIHELRIGFGSVNYRILYFFHGSTAAIVTHGITKEDKVPNKEIELAIARRRLFLSDVKKYSHPYEKGDILP